MYSITYVYSPNCRKKKAEKTGKDGKRPVSNDGQAEEVVRDPVKEAEVLMMQRSVAQISKNDCDT